jgi:predicted RecA/RadA family phage recombinase
MTDRYDGNGQVLDVTAGGTITNGSVQRVSHTVGVALKGAASGEVYPLKIAGRFRVPKATGTAWAQGEKLIWDASLSAFNGSATVAASGDVLGCAVAALAALSADAEGYVILTPGNTTLTP